MEVTMQQRALLTPKVTQPLELGQKGARVFILTLKMKDTEGRSEELALLDICKPPVHREGQA